MNEFLFFFDQNSVDGIQVVLFMFFSLGIALFHTLIFSGLYNLKFPTWLLYALYPSIIGLSFLVHPRYPLMIVLFLFACIFLFGIIGMIYAGIIKSREEKEKREKFNRLHNIEKTPFYKKIIGLLILASIIWAYCFLAERGIIKIIFLIIPALILLNKIFFPSVKSKFLKLQSVLPTSKMNAIAMGMVEVEGDLEQIEPLISPYFSKPCIGYYYKIEEESPPDDDGHTTYYTIFSETKVGVFKIKDETGAVTVNGEGLEFYFERTDKQAGGKMRYSETYLQNNDYMFLIGYASSDNGNVVIKKESPTGIFGIAIPQSISFRNKYNPLLNSFLITLFFIAVIIIFIILN